MEIFVEFIVIIFLVLLLLGFNFLLQLSSAEIRGELSTILEWLVPVASNTTKAHHGFGWVGEWANTG
jgi:hypothetical protein